MQLRKTKTLLSHLVDAEVLCFFPLLFWNVQLQGGKDTRSQEPVRLRLCAFSCSDDSEYLYGMKQARKCCIFARMLTTSFCYTYQFLAYYFLWLSLPFTIHFQQCITSKAYDLLCWQHVGQFVRIYQPVKLNFWSPLCMHT